MYTDIHMYIYVYVYTYLHICKYVCIYICQCMCLYDGTVDATTGLKLDNVNMYIYVRV